MSAVNNAGATNVDVEIDGKPVNEQHLMSVTVERDLNQPDMAAVALTNTDHSYSSIKHGATLKVKVSKDAVVIYEGEVVGLEPHYKAGEPTRIVVRGMNKLHRLLRGRKSKTYSEMTDKDIISKVASGHGLSVEWDGPTITHHLVYQHNQTDLEFVRHRASRLGLDVWVVGAKLFVKKPALDKDSGIILSVAKEVATGSQLRNFTPRMSSAPVVKKVTVKGWNPEKKELIVGEASPESSKLGSTGASSAAAPFGDVETFTVDHPIWSKEEATALAKARLQQLSLGYMTGEADAVGDPRFVPGIVVKIIVAPDREDTFNGKYFISGVTHKYSRAAKDGGFSSALRIVRDAQKGGGS